MNQNAVHSRIAAAIARQAGASSTEQYPVRIEQGQEKQRPRAGAGQIESSVHMSTWTEVDPQPKEIKPADLINTDPPAPKEAETVTIGNVTIRHNPIFGTWEGRFTRGTTSHEVLVNGVPVTGDSAIAAVYAALLAQRSENAPPSQQTTTKGRK